MKTIACVVLLTAAVALAEPATSRSLDTENEALRQRVAALEAEVAALKAHVQKLQTQRPALGQLQIVPPRIDLRSGQLQMTVPAPGAPQPPQGWVPQQFNGVQHYLVPLEHAAGQRDKN